MNFSFFLCLAACRTRSSAWDTLSRTSLRRATARRYLSAPSGACFADPCSPWSPPFAPPPPPPVARLCSAASSLLWRSLTSHARASPASAPRLPDADQRRRTALAGHEISRFPHKERLHMPGSQTAPGRAGARNSAPVHIAFHNEYSVGARFSLTFAAQWLACALPCQRFVVIFANVGA